ncbi:hypothetical protein HAP48_0025785 [Bradyrhizobium septentrionale]|nr:hypothetical protein [Bradyrhizobium septentrionale]UGY12158.1 hypothetical protein HAP48_0025785 [Bradyrhizobium septentrionale]
MTDFQADVGQHIKIYPSLFQGSATTGRSTDVYLQAGQSVNGVVYFEQRDSWGGFMPFPKSHRTRVKVAVKDVFGTHHKQCFWIPVVPLAEAQKYNPSFGQTYHSLQQEGGKAGA